MGSDIFKTGHKHLLLLMEECRREKDRQHHLNLEARLPGQGAKLILNVKSGFESIGVN